jgi:hypothetical protein
MNGFGKLGGCTERDAIIVDFYLYLAAALVHHPPAHPASSQPLPLGHPRRSTKWLK